MRWFLSVLLLLSFQAYGKSLSVFWWNVGGNSYSDDLGDYTTLDETFMQKDFSGFDVVALGEFKKAAMAPSALKNLTRNFPYQKEFRYNETSSQRIFVLSKHPFRFKSLPVDWIPTEFSASERSQYIEKTKKIQNTRWKNFKRSYNRITLNVAGKDLHMVFYHFNNPWPGYTETFGKYQAGIELVLGKRNPLMYQLKNFQKRLIQDLGKNYRRKNLLMMGDSNCPYRVKGVVSMCMRRMQSHLLAVIDHAKEYTFPSPYYRNAADFPKVKIDHAQASIYIKKESLNVLDWEGSDHLPLKLEFEI